MTAAIIGLVGVIIGSLATGGVTYVLDRRREEAETLAPLRLLDFDLLAAWASVNRALSDGERHTLPEGWDPPLSGWRDHRHTAASAFDGNDWRQVAMGGSGSSSAWSTGSSRGDSPARPSHSTTPTGRRSKASATR